MRPTSSSRSRDDSPHARAHDGVPSRKRHPTCYALVTLASLAGRTLRLRSRQAESAPARAKSSCYLLLIGRDEGFGYKGFVACGRGVFGRARLKGVHFSGIECAGHFQKQLGKLLGHSHLNQGAASLIVGQVNVRKVRLADRGANRGSDFGIGEVALSQQFTGLFAAEGGM